ncbi:MAG TPA: hypothetical protein VGV89_02205 [Thermoplasmata archaeon]|nr:hypothetical protein [Thermoplasmata archaeon]
MSGRSWGSSTLPVGVAILAILIGIVGFILVLGGLLILLGFAIFDSVALYGVGLIGGLIVLIFGIVLLVVASGLWDLEMWALALALLVLLISLALNLYDIFYGHGGSVLVTVVEGLLVVYLLAVSSHFS